MISFTASKHFVLGAALLLCAGCSSSSTSPSSGGPNGTIYFAETAQGVIKTLDISSGKLTNIVTADMPNVRSDKWILCLLAGNLAFVSPDGSQSQLILAQSFAGGAYQTEIYEPQLSPDGKYVAYYQQISDMVYVVSASTGALILSVGNLSLSTFYSRPAWGKDGSLYVQATPFAGVQTGGGIFKIDNAFKTMVRIDQNLNTPIEPKISPDGATIAFILSNQLWTMGIDGSNPKQMTSTTAAEFAPAWSPDGKWIAVSTNQCDILLVPTDGTAIVDLGAKFPTTIGGGYNCPAGDDQMDWK